MCTFVTRSPRGLVTELVQRIYGQRNHVISMFGLSSADIYGPVCLGLEVGDELRCEICNGLQVDADDPLIYCDGNHDLETCFHTQCVNLTYVPAEAWMCPQCLISGRYIVESIVGKRKVRGLVEYLVHWQNFEAAQDSWQKASEMPIGCAPLVTAYNRIVL